MARIPYPSCGDRTLIVARTRLSISIRLPPHPEFALDGARRMSPLVTALLEYVNISGNQKRITRWLLRTAAMICRDCERQRRRRHSDYHPEDAMRNDVTDAVDALLDRYCQVVVLHYYLRTYRDAVAQQLGLTLDAVEKRLQRSHRGFVQRLRDVCDCKLLHEHQIKCIGLTYLSKIQK